MLSVTGVFVTFPFFYIYSISVNRSRVHCHYSAWEENILYVWHGIYLTIRWNKQSRERRPPPAWKFGRAYSKRPP